MSHEVQAESIVGDITPVDGVSEEDKQEREKVGNRAGHAGT